ncbi:ADP-dependent glucokinase [Methanosarcina sp. MTP4]|uniref:ADP-dependent glucokinase/phosphofructokinase n=1 Tax=Methanosarcina sp. MTP4 TaxID=1434100 RepID=UPI0006157C3B|nr:ADP-dependent glucokinase/phosphofructokinase [Methanosarcina sp. MTP4]AKB25854.1 ADP-dependent glucokinase [Methanosarcina sp. MTP4]
MKILCGYNVNIDSVYRMGGAELSELLEFFESSEILEKIDSPPGRIDSKSDFAAGLAYCMKNGFGAEWLVFNPSVFEFLKGLYFEKSLVRMGGNAGIMANTISELGASLVVPNVAVPSKTQLSLFSRKSVYFPGISSLEGPGEAEVKSQVDEIKVDASAPEQDPIHFVFDFSEGESFSIYGKQFTVPRENRFIATCDQLNFRLFINPDFDAYALQHAGEMDGALISGFHLLLEEYPDGGSYLEIVEQVLSRVLAWKAGNERLRVHLEFGHFGNRKLACTVFSKFAGIVDSLGMNEDELASFHEMHGIPVEGLLRMNAEAVGKAASCLASLHRLQKLVVHTREFVLAAVRWDDTGSSACGCPERPELIRRPFYSREVENEIEALEFGVKCAGTYAATGRLDGRDFVETGVSKLQESELGRGELSRFLEAFGGEAAGNGAFAFRGVYMLCMLPTLLSKSPVTTVGLGDTLTAGVFLRRLELDVQA